MDYGYPPHVKSPEDRTVIVCGCGWHTPDMTEAELGQRGVPWYCEDCGKIATRFATFAPHERAEAMRFLGVSSL